jgi:soluble lytic murein transglycosylase-like protein
MAEILADDKGGGQKGARKSLGMLLLACLVLPVGPTVQADIYKYEDYRGHIYLTDKPMKGRYRLLKVFRNMGARPVTSGLNAETYRRNRARFTPIIDAVAERLELAPELLHAVVKAESAYDPNAVSKAGAVGLMQLMPGTAEVYGVADRRDPVANVNGGARYLRDLLELFGQNLELALAAYNAGENAVKSYGNRIPPYPETQGYVRKVLSFYQANAGGS